MVIRTPDQRLRVFISSTLGELAEERQAVARAIAALRLTPVLFEAGARPHRPAELYRAYLAQSDVFIGLYWQRYGQVPAGRAVSGLEEELELSAGMPRLLYVKTPAPGREPRLAERLARVREEASYRQFTTHPPSWAGWCARTWRRCSASGSSPAKNPSRRRGRGPPGRLGRGRCLWPPARCWGGNRRFARSPPCWGRRARAW